MDVPGKWIDRVAHQRSSDKLILDLNSSVTPRSPKNSLPYLFSAMPTAGVSMVSHA